MNAQLQTIVDNLLAGNHQWLVDNYIVYKDKGDYWVLNYHKIADKNEYNMLTRGLVIHKTGKLTSVPFFRFLNFGEPKAAKVDFNNSDVMEKLDGSMVGVCFPSGDVTKPVWHFRNLLSTYQQDRDFVIKGFVHNEEAQLLDEVKVYLDQITFPKEWVDFTLIFEFVSRCNAVVTRYEPEQYGLYLIGARHLPSLKEMDENYLDELAKHLNVRRPRRWDANSYDEIMAEMAKLPKEKVYEGFIIRDRITGERNKVKNDDYVKRHRLLDKLSYKNLLPLWFEGEQEEILTYFPKTKEIFDKIENAVNAFAKEAVDALLYWQHRDGTRKDKAIGIQAIVRKPVASIVFKFLEEKCDRETNHRNVMEFLSLAAKERTKFLIEQLSLKDDVIEGVIDEMIA